MNENKTLLNDKLRAVDPTTYSNRMSLNHDLNKLDIHVCTRCIYDERIGEITFDHEGVCNFCHQTDRLKEEYGTGTEIGEARLQSTCSNGLEATSMPWPGETLRTQPPPGAKSYTTTCGDAPRMATTQGS